MPDGTSISIQPFSTAGVRKIVFNEVENSEDYDMICVPVTEEHGTGHGVGSYLSVHEGPQSISRRGVQELLPGMILSKFTPFFIKRVGRWYCSEWIAYALRLAGVVDNLYHYSDLTPERLHEVLRKYAD